MSSSAPSGIVADGYERYTNSERFLTRERAARLIVLAAFAPRLAHAQSWRERLRLLWERRRALRELRPSPYACYAVPPDDSRPA